MKFESRHRRGFTLIELLVTISIFIVMTALIVSRYGAFNQGTLMTNLAYDVALSLRTAQTFGVSVKGTENNLAGGRFDQTFNSAYGVHFAANQPTSFLTFLDNNTPPNGIYDPGSGVDTLYSTYSVKQGATISGLCVGTDGQDCDAGSANALDISFRRPDPSAFICASGGSVIPCSNGSSPYNYAEITLTSADKSSSRTIQVRGNGQISVKD